MLKFCAEELILPLTNVINASFSHGIFPSNGKVAIIKPLFKKGDPHLVDHYRPISLLPAVSKILEKIVSEYLLECLEKNDLFFKNQYGFRKNKSTKLALIHFIQKSIDAIEKGETVIGCFVDLSKAFDCVDISILIEKIAAVGIGGVVLNWIKSYLVDRKQITSVKHKDDNNSVLNIWSDELGISNGVPQGSILGPLFFLLYVNDISQFINPDGLVMFADDTTVFAESRNIQELEINTFRDVNLLSQYFSDNKLVINAGKTNFVHFQTAQLKARNPDNYINILLGDSELTESGNANFLGVTVDSHLKWEDHTFQLSIKIAKGLYVIRGFTYLGNINLSKLIYFSLIESHLRYSIVLWGSSSRQNLDRIFILQKRAIRAITGVPPRTPCRNLFKCLNIMTVPALYIYEAIVYVKQNNLIGSNNHSYETRNRYVNAFQQHSLGYQRLNQSMLGGSTSTHFQLNSKTFLNYQLKKVAI